MMSAFEGLEAMDLEKRDDSSKEVKGGGLSASCSICLELVLDQGDRSKAKLQCGHEFHLDCIGSAFNAKGAMQCPNCRKVEKGRWLYAHGHRASSDFDLDGWMTEDIYDLGFPEHPFGIHWCPYRGFMPLAALFEEGESPPNPYNELMGNPTFGNHSSSSTSTHVCPYLAVHPHSMHSSTPSSADSAPENGPFHRHPPSLGGQPSADMNSHSSATELRNQQQWGQRPPFPFPSSNAGQPASHLGMRLSRNDTSSQQRLGSFVHPHSLVPGSIAHGGSNVVTSLGTPVAGDVRGHTRSHGSHMYQQPVPSATPRRSPFAPIRRTRPRGGVTLISSVATASSADIGGLYGFSVSGSVNSTHQDGESNGRHFDHVYRWGREGFTPLPWIPLEGESQWWSPFNPNLNPQSASFPQRAPPTERVSQIRPDNGYHRMPPSRMHPFI